MAKTRAEVVFDAYRKAKGRMDQFRVELSHCPCPKCGGKFELFLGTLTPETKKRGMYKGGVYVVYCKGCNSDTILPVDKETFQWTLLCVAFDGGKLVHVKEDIPKDYWFTE